MTAKYILKLLISSATTNISFLQSQFYLILSILEIRNPFASQGDVHTIKQNFLHSPAAIQNDIAGFLHAQWVYNYPYSRRGYTTLPAYV
jgi:hypothetical protein